MPNNVYVVEVKTSLEFGDPRVLELAAESEEHALYMAATEVATTLSISSNQCMARILVDETLFLNLENREDQIWVEAGQQNDRNWYLNLFSMVFGIITGGIVTYFLTVGR